MPNGLIFFKKKSTLESPTAIILHHRVDIVKEFNYLRHSDDPPTSTTASN